MKRVVMFSPVRNIVTHSACLSINLFFCMNLTTCLDNLNKSDTRLTKLIRRIETNELINDTGASISSI